VAGGADWVAGGEVGVGGDSIAGGEVGVGGHLIAGETKAAGAEIGGVSVGVAAEVMVAVLIEG
jgi:hypothetical protein